MASVYHLRNRNYWFAFVIFQIIFVAVQVFLFYPCWQRAPDSTIFRRFHANQHPPPRLQPDKSQGSFLQQQGDNLKQWVSQGINALKTPENGGGQVQSQAGVLQQPEYQHAKAPGNSVADVAGKVIDTMKAKVGFLSQNGSPQNKQQLPAQQQQQQERLQQQQRDKEGEQLRGQKLRMQQAEEQMASQQNLLASKTKYNTSWESLDSRPNPQWYDAGKIGIFIHWGVYSVPSFSVSNGLAEWFWFYWKSNEFVRPLDEYNSKRFENFLQHKTDAIKGVKDFASRMYGPKWRYTDFATEFKAEMFDPQHWANIFKQSGAKYVVLTSKHHDGFTLWPSRKSWNWNSVDVGPHHDLVGELGKAVRAAGLHYGLYHSLYEWFNPKYIEDKKNGFTTQTFVREKMMPELKELITTYRPDIVWSDGQFEAPCSYWNCTDFLAWLYNESPVRDVVVTNDRWGSDVSCKHGGYLTCQDRFIPDKKLGRKWENCMTIDRESWGYRRNAVLDDYYTIHGLLELLAQTVSKGGNILINVGPTADGRIPPIFEERLKQLGEWLQVNGEAIYGTTAWSTSSDPTTKNVYYTLKSSNTGPVVYAIVLAWPESDRLELAAPLTSSQTTVSWLGYQGGPIAWKAGSNGGLALSLPKVSLAHVPCRWAWVFQLNNLLNAAS